MTELIDLAGLTDLLLSQTGRRLTAIAGPPGAGKSTIADELAEAINARACGAAAVLPMDGYHFDDAILKARGDHARKGAPFTFDVTGFRHMMERLRANEETETAVPVFDRSLEIARAGARLIPSSIRHIIVEGNYLLLDDPAWLVLAPLFDQTVFLDVPREVLQARLEQRWQHLVGDAKRLKMDGNDMPNVDLVRTRSRPAMFVIKT